MDGKFHQPLVWKMSNIPAGKFVSKPSSINNNDRSTRNLPYFQRDWPRSRQKDILYGASFEDAGPADIKFPEYGHCLDYGPPAVDYAAPTDFDNEAMDYVQPLDYRDYNSSPELRELFRSHDQTLAQNPASQPEPQPTNDDPQQDKPKNAWQAGKPEQTPYNQRNQKIDQNWKGANTVQSEDAPSQEGLKNVNINMPTDILEKKKAQVLALQNLSKLKAMLHMASEDRRTKQHKREEARRQFLSLVGDELQLMSSAKAAQLAANQAYHCLVGKEKELSKADLTIHSLRDEENVLYDDLTEAEAALADADFNYIPKIRSPTELKHFASYLNFGA